MYTKENLEAVEKAIGDIQSGRRVVGASYGETRVQYANTSLAELINLRSRIIADLGGGKRRVIFTTSKGLE
jgi:hypothetical protein